MASRSNEELAVLAARAKKGDMDAFRLLYDATYKSIYYILLIRLKNEFDAKDVLQDVYMDVYRTLNQLKNEMAFVAWLHKIAHLKCLMFLRKNTKLQGNVSIDDSAEDLTEEDSEFLPQEALYKKELQEMILSIIEELPDHQKTVLLMAYYDELSTTEIASACNITVGAVRKRLHDARKVLKNRLEKKQREGVRLYSMGIIPILTVLFKRDAEMRIPDILGERLWENISRSLPTTTPTPVSDTSVFSVGSKIKGAVGSGFKFAGFVKAAAAVTLIGLTPAIISSLINYEPDHVSMSYAKIEGQKEIRQQENIPENQSFNEILPEEFKGLAGESAVVLGQEPTPAGNFKPEASEAANQPINLIIAQEALPAGVHDPPKTENSVQNIIEDPPYVPPDISQDKPLEYEDGDIVITYEIGKEFTVERLAEDISWKAVKMDYPSYESVEKIFNSLNISEPSTTNFTFTMTEKHTRNYVEWNIQIIMKDTTPPKILYNNRMVSYPQGEIQSLEKICQDSGLRAEDNATGILNITTTGYDKINFNKPGQYPIAVYCKDESGISAPPDFLIVLIE